MKIVFMGTPNFSVPVLNGLIENYDVVGVVCQPDKEVGRHRILEAPPTKVVAEEHGIKVFQPIKIRKEFDDILALEPDMIVTCAYGQIIPKEILDYPKYGCINVHASLLPKLRGGAPIHRAIMNGDKETGITIMYMDEGMDTGDIITMESIPILEEDNLETVSNKLSTLGRDLLLKTLPDIVSGNITRTKQNNDEATFGYNIKREEEHIDFNIENKEDIYNHIRGLYPEPSAYAILDESPVKIFESYKNDVINDANLGEITHIYKDGIGVNTKDGEIVITEFQISGKKRMKVKDYFNGIDPKSLLGKVFK